MVDIGKWRFEGHSLSGLCVVSFWFNVSNHTGSMLSTRRKVAEMNLSKGLQRMKGYLILCSTSLFCSHPVIDLKECQRLRVDLRRQCLVTRGFLFFFSLTHNLQVRMNGMCPRLFSNFFCRCGHSVCVFT